jgi:hypothetical protein
MAIRGPDPHNIRGMLAKQKAPIIDSDRECPGCGYNLRGLRVGIKCPECGMPSVMPAEVDDALSLMPRAVILEFIWGCWIASLCVFAAAGVIVADQVHAFDHTVTEIVLTGTALVWAIACWMLTPAFALPQAVFWGFSKRSRLRLVARWLGPGWLMALTAALLEPFAAQLILVRPLLWLASVGGAIAGLASIVTLSIMLERLAEWTRDDTAQKIFNGFVWGLPLVVLGGLLQFQLPLPFLMVGLALGCLVLLLCFPLGLLMLSKSVTLSIVHSYEHEHRTRRREERKQAYFAKVIDRVAPRND